MSVRVRGTALHNTVRSVRRRFGDEAHQRVLGALPAARCGPFLAGVRDAGWVAMDDVVAYMEAARSLLAPADPGFFLALGHDAGLRIADSPVRLLFGHDPRTAMGRSAYFWRMYYDAGRAEMEDAGERALVLRAVDWPTSGRAWCERTAGFLAGCFEALRFGEVRVTEPSCRHRGDPGCAFRMEW